MNLRLLLFTVVALVTSGRLAAAYTYQLTSLTQDAFEQCYYQG